MILKIKIQNNLKIPILNNLWLSLLLSKVADLHPKT